MSKFLGSVPTVTCSQYTSAVLEEPIEIIKESKDQALEISNADFLNQVFAHLPEGAFAAVCSKSGDPTQGGWSAKRADLFADKLSVDTNNYLCCSSFRCAEDHSINVRKENFVATHFLMLDDPGTKFPMASLGGLPMSWLVETSPGNHQAGILLSEPLTDGEQATQLLNAIIAAGLSDPGASGPMSRWARLPVAINGKEKYADESGQPFRCRLIEFHPERRYTHEQIVAGLKLKRPSSAVNAMAIKPMMPVPHGNEVFTPKAAENPVLTALKERSLYKTPLGSGKHDITCPWLEEHTDSIDSGTAYFEPDDSFAIGGFCCQHSHHDEYHIGELLQKLGVNPIQARNKPVLRMITGEINSIINAIEGELAKSRDIYQSGGLLVVVKNDTATGCVETMPITKEALTRLLSAIVIWEKYDGRSKGWVRCDPPVRHINILYDAQIFNHVPVLLGVARQPYFRETDGKLMTEAGYDPVSKLFGVFDSSRYVQPEPTRVAAQAALALLMDLLMEFHFVADTDKAAALSALLTAVTRPSLNYAPAYHVRAPASGSGKSYLCDLIGAFATPGENRKSSYPTSSEEATKSILSALLSNPALIDFDDMTTDWIPHGIINRVLTSETISDRILGASKIATVRTRTLFLGSGNNVGPVRDLLRRVLTIHIDARNASPATMSYEGLPVDKVRKNRERYITAVLTIISAWKMAGSPKSKVQNIT